jgi:polar amino acid transport system permease protein
MLETFLNPQIIKAAWPIILAGLGNTVMLSLVVVPLGLIGGLALAMLASVRKPWVRWPLMAWVDFFRAFPPLVLLIFLYAGQPFAGLELGGFACVCIASSSTPAPTTARSCAPASIPSPPARPRPPAAPASAVSRPCST